MTAQAKALVSAGHALPVMDDGRLARWWPALHGHIPGATAAALTPLPPLEAEAVVDVTGYEAPSPARRVINAHLHLLHLEHDTLSVHAAALAAPTGDGAVLLLGGHGAGKTLVATALALAGWAPIAGDVALVHVDTTTAAVVGGTAAFMVRSAPTARWFPHVPLPDGESTDLGAWWAARPARVAAPVLGAVWVRVDGDPQVGGVQAAPMDAHTARTAWWKAGSHLIDRLAPPGHDPLRLLELPDLARRRTALTTTVAEQFPLTVLCGDPYAIAAAIGHHIREGSSR
ncbi:hypothetical protein AB0M72_07090 [Nocardiopsis dassonvillei]